MINYPFPQPKLRKFTMPKARAIRTYPNEVYLEVVKPVLEGVALEKVFPMTKTQALTTRADLYAWRRAAEAEPVVAIGLGIPLEKLRHFLLQVTDEGLKVSNVNHTGGLGALRAALAADGVAIAAPKTLADEMDQAARESLARLRAMGIETTSGSKGSES